ncbi:hypothetical protein [Rhizobium sp. G21]|uniref:hypothetical protein n=1 Tax=Rhizobium sp. G21 TaxID=2758439 RepID=UPI00160303E8|nr:hypothetical protein [Rhizobium sp. G21]MBB1249203.1 hypothetical protein [Rhizobium sp. G21]
MNMEVSQRKSVLESANRPTDQDENQFLTGFTGPRYGVDWQGTLGSPDAMAQGPTPLGSNCRLTWSGHSSETMATCGGASAIH